ncbi:MAG: alpha-2-macroglobulin family protein, partial [Gemmataceae bacterium]
AQVAYFYGKPVANADVEVALTTETVDERGLGGRVHPDDLPRPREMRITTDASGRARFRFEQPAALGRHGGPGDARIVVAATVVDKGGHKQTRRASRVVTERVLRVQAVAEGGQLVKGIANKVYLFATYPDGTPVADAQLEVRGAGTLIEDGLRTDKLGFATCEVRPQANHFPLEIRIRDTLGRTARAGIGLACGEMGHDFLLRPDKAVYTAGDAMLLKAFGGGPGSIYIDILRGGQTVLTDTIDMKDGKGEYHFDIPADLSGTLELCAYRFGADGLPVRRSRIFYVKQAKQLAIKTVLDRPEYRPGDLARLRFTLTDGAGNPAPGALSLAAVDEAVFSVLPQAPGMERTFFLLERELLEPIYTIYPWDPAGRPELPVAEWDRFEQGLFARTAQVSVDSNFRVVNDQARGRRGMPVAAEPDVMIGMREAEEGVEWPAPPQQASRNQHSLTASSYFGKVRDAADTRELAHKWIVGGWVALIGTSLLTGYVWLWILVRPFWMIAGHILLVIPALAMFSVIGSSARSTFNTVGFKLGADLGEAAPAMAQRTPMEGGRGPAAPARVRQEFPETLLWLPELITDDQGHATLELPLADSITTWRLSTSGVDASGRLGSENTPIKVFQPFFVDIDLPVTLTRNDEVAIPVTVYNYLKKPQSVLVELEQADWFKLEGEAKQKIDLGPNEVRSVSYRLRALHVGSQPVQVTARTTELADAVKRQIEVVPDGEKIEIVVNDRLTGNAEHRFHIPENAVPGSYKILVKVYPGVFSQVVEGLDGMLRMPTGCFEQTSSSAYPNLLIIDYLKKTRTTSPALMARAEQYLQVGYQRLLTFERPGGGFDWWGRDPAVVWLSAYGLQEFNDMSKVMTIDKGIIGRTQDYLMNQQNSDGSWDKIGATHGVTIERMGNPRLLLTSYIVWSLLDSGMPASNANLKKAIDYVLDHLDDAGTNPYVMALVGNALAAWDPRDERTLAVLKTLDGLARAVPDCDAVHFPSDGTTLTYARAGGADVETTALAALAMLKAGVHPATVNRAVNYIIKAKRPGGDWGSTQATILSLKVLIAAMGTAKQEGNINLAVALNDGKPVHKLVTPKNADVMQLIDLQADTRTGNNDLSIQVEGKSNLMYQVIARHYRPWSVEQPRQGKVLDL